MPQSSVPDLPRPPRPIVTPYPVPPIVPPPPPGPVSFAPSQYSGIGEMPFDPRAGGKPTPAPFAPGAFMRPAQYPMPVTELPAGLAGPIFPQVGWHFGPPVYLGEPPYGADRCQPSPRGRIIGGYGSLHYGEADPKKDSEKELTPGQKAGLVALVAVGVAVPVASSILFGRKYGGPGYVLGFFVPGAIGAAIAALRGKTEAAPAATVPA